MYVFSFHTHIVYVEREAGEVELKEECEALKQQLCSRTAQLKDECDALKEQLKCARDEAARALASSTDVEEALQEAYTGRLFGLIH